MYPTLRRKRTPAQFTGTNRTYAYKLRSNTARILAEGLLPNAKNPMVLQAFTSLSGPTFVDFYLWYYLAGPNGVEWSRQTMKRDASLSTGMYGLKEMSTWNIYPWTAFANANTTYASGTWTSNISGSTTNFGLNFYTLAAAYCEVSATGAGDLYIACVSGTDRSYIYVTINGATMLVNNLPTSGSNKYIDGYSASNALQITKVATGLPQGTYTVRLTRSTTERNIANTTGFRMFPDSYAIAGSGSIYPNFSGTDTVMGQCPRLLKAVANTVFTSLTTASPPSAWSAFTDGALGATTDYFYAGGSLKFAKLLFAIATGNTGGGTMPAQYWNGTAWTTLTITDGTSAMANSGTISWVPPSDWATTTVNGALAYWVRFSFSATTTAVTTTSVMSGVVNNYTQNFLGQSPGSQMEYAFNFTPNSPNNTIQAVGGELHGGESQTSMTVTADGAAQTLTAGQSITAKQIQFVQNMNIVHSTAGNVGTGTLTHNWFGNTLSVRYKSILNIPCVLNSFSYFAMYPAIWYGQVLAAYGFNRAKILAPRQDNNAAVNFDTAGMNTNNGKIKGAGALFYSTLSDYFCVISHQINIQSNNNWATATNQVYVNNNPGNISVPGGSSAISKYYESKIDGGSSITVAAGATQEMQSYYTFARSPASNNIIN